MNSPGQTPTLGLRETLPKDFLSSIVVFLVALPLCMGIAIASGCPPEAGLITGMVGGLVVALLSGCPLQVSGPAAGLTVIVWDIVREHGIAMLGIILVLAGLMQLMAGLLKLGQWFRAVSPAVINGMLSGIGLLIFVSQFHVMLDDKPKGTGLVNLLSIPGAFWDTFIQVETGTGHIAGGIGLLTIIILVMWASAAPKKLRMIPAGLVAVVVATIVAQIFHLNIKTVELPTNLLSAVHLPPTNLLPRAFELKIILEALGVAFIASAETLLTATAVDRMQQGPRTKYDKELTAQGIGNIICGLLGALPMTGVIVRSGINVQAGAMTRRSAFMHGLWLLLFVIFLEPVLDLIPTSCLAALLVYTGYKLINVKVIKSLLPYGKSEVAIYVCTLTTILCTDLLTGVLVGMGLTAAKLLYIFSHLEIVMKVKEHQTELNFKGAATFLSLPKLAQALEKVDPTAELHVHLEQLDYIDHACLDLLMNWEVQHKAMGGSLVIDWSSLGTMFRERRRRVDHEKGETLERAFAKQVPGNETAVTPS